uniref:NADH-ubiquinone oxidoreductase chain 4L n=1 Tax=Arctica islandica TaxID=59239 RepID=T1QR06_ARCIS|nr:NADH dehydrogenase subunit 4L [Arctica islandica]AGC84102.1 NADH dehydrogenase subunit 4L [Arctica islandica]AGW53600.1 NADH dehydrogenase subunit 4L [Arctica islandica]AGW53612.1 NADH dehydrogenase subunit 4L [Arctica islandica]AHB12595.1 NADH dehydrogenase subunit 4L [Arctica islandica]AHB12597.1 NADH dehydrogenase subunit 4L [Arctica islandica]
MSLCFIFFIFSFFFVSFHEKHFLSLLLIFEVLTISVFIGSLFFIGLSMNLMGLYFCVVLLTLGVCEAVLGLSLLVSSVRFTGKKQVKSFSFLGF